MKSKNLEREKFQTFERISESEINIRLAEQAEERLDLRKINAKVIDLIEAKKKLRKDFFEKGLF